MFKYIINYIELRTKVASVLPFLIVVTTYIYLQFPSLSLPNTLLYFLSMLCLDMCVTILNHNAGFTNETVVSNYDLDLLNNPYRKYNRMIFSGLLTIGISCGILLTFRSNIYTLILGALAFGVGIIYSFGPFPLKNTCLGEIASGGTMGFILPLIFIYSQLNNLPIALSWEVLIKGCLFLLVLSGLIGMIMLGNNICDLEIDKKNSRHTLVVILGLNNSLNLLSLGYLIIYLLIVINTFIGTLPLFTLISLLTIPKVLANLQLFKANCSSKRGFPFIISNFIIITSTLVVSNIFAILFIYV